MTEITLTEQVNAVVAQLSQDIKNNKLEIPSPPDLLIEIRRLSADQNTTAKDIAELVKHDINISGRLIKIANCSLFGSRAQVETVQAAITRLGQKKVQSLITGLIIGQQFMQSKTRGLESFCEQAWQTSNNVAAMSYVLAKEKSKIDPEQALLAGMVHNIGVLPIILKLNKVQALKDNPKIMTLVANVVIPKLYSSAGRLIMTNWNFPPEIVNVATNHRQLKRESSDMIDLSDLVLIAHQLNQLDSYQDSEHISEELTESSSFQKFWKQSNDAAENLSELSETIEQMKHDITH
ncbi:MAG: HDOD domain-containing protein [Methylophagaceae bacterium]